MKLKSIILGLSLVTISFTSMAVDGYKGVKFGSNFEDLKAAKICSWKQYADNKVKGMDTYYCDNFKFSGLNTIAMAIFMGGSFERFSIVLNDNQDVTALADSLMKKYGKPSSSFTQEEFKDFQNNGGSLTVKFDEDTVILGMNRDPGTKADSMQLLYSSPSYFEKLKKLQQKNMEGDL